MALSKSFTRPLATTTATESSPLTATLTEGSPSGQWTLDLTATIGGAEKLFRRLVINPAFSGVNLSLTVTEYVFSGSATSVSATNPNSSTAVSSATYSLTVQDFDAVYTAGGDARS